MQSSSFPSCQRKVQTDLVILPQIKESYRVSKVYLEEQQKSKLEVKNGQSFIRSKQTFHIHKKNFLFDTLYFCILLQHRTSFASDDVFAYKVDLNSFKPSLLVELKLLEHIESEQLLKKTVLAIILQRPLPLFRDQPFSCVSLQTFALIDQGNSNKVTLITFSLLLSQGCIRVKLFLKTIPAYSELPQID